MLPTQALLHRRCLWTSILDRLTTRAIAIAMGRELSQGRRGGLSNPREREALDTRDVFTRDLELPRGQERERVWARDSDVRLRGSEVR